MASKSYYDLLGVPDSASIDDIRKAYRIAMREFHPDLNPELEKGGQRSRELNAALTTLTDPDRRAKYDRQLAKVRRVSRPQKEPSTSQASAKRPSTASSQPQPPSPKAQPPSPQPHPSQDPAKPNDASEAPKSEDSGAAPRSSASSSTSTPPNDDARTQSTLDSTATWDSTELQHAKAPKGRKTNPPPTPNKSATQTTKTQPFSWSAPKLSTGNRFLKMHGWIIVLLFTASFLLGFGFLVGVQLLRSARLALSTAATEVPSEGTESTFQPANHRSNGKNTAPAIPQNPFSEKAASEFQSSWAAALNQPVELTNSIGMTFRLIPPGTFVMGSNDPGAQDETTHLVHLTTPYFVGAHEVTQAAYMQVMRQDPSSQKGDNLPVDSVSWEDAMLFCEKLSELQEEIDAGRSYRLLSEAEWEFACRAGTTTKYSFGDDWADLSEYAWNYENARRPQQVGTRLPNAFGLYDMHGNVWEYCQDWYAIFTDEELTDPTGPSSSYNRVIRGGSCITPESYRSSYRGQKQPRSYANNIGFRVVMELKRRKASD